MIGGRIVSECWILSHHGRPVHEDYNICLHIYFSVKKYSSRVLIIAV
jgi:hypothetical protein